MTERKPRRYGGFSTMDPEKHRAIASKGGIAAHAQGRAHEFTSEEARAAGKKGGVIIGQDKAHMAEIGRLGGESKKRRARERKAS